MKRNNMVKQLTAGLLSLLMLLCLAAWAPAAMAEESEFKTMGDTYAYATEGPANLGDLCISVFEKYGAWYRAEAAVPAEVNAKIEALEGDETYDDQVRELLKDLPVTKIVVLSDYLLSHADLDALAGKTGQELLDMGFVPMEEYDFGEAETRLVLAKGTFNYEVFFNEAVEPQKVPNLAEVMAPLTVKSAAFTGELNYYAWEPEFDPEGSPVYEYIAPPSFPIPEIAVEDSPFKTLADVYAAMEAREDPHYFIAGPTNGFIVFAFETKDGHYYRVEANVPADIQEQLDAIDFFDEERDSKQQALLGPLPVTRVGDVSACLPTQAELDALVGKTGQELLDMGFVPQGTYGFGDGMSFAYLDNGLFGYQIDFKEKNVAATDDDFDLEEVIRPLTVEKVAIYGFADVCSDPDLIW